ncbi:MAG: SDR family NAD(P)-dependent oxidoreductase [Acidimicrobiia bacterium]
MAHKIRTVDDRAVVVVTGAASGMGEDAVLYLNQLGYTVVAGIRRPEEGDALVARASQPGRIHPVLLDVTDEAQVDAARTVVEGLVEGGLPFAAHSAARGSRTSRATPPARGPRCRCCRR